MFCRVCLHRNMKVFYKLNDSYIDLMKTITEVKMKLNDLVCCFCLETLRKIEKFIKTVKEVDFILKHSIKTEEDVNEVNKYYNLAVSASRNISIDCSRALYGTYAHNIKNELLREFERDLVKIEEIEDDPLQLSEDTIFDNGTDSTSDVPLIIETVIKEEQNESIDQNEAVLPEKLKMTSIKEENNKVVTELPCVKKVVKQNIISRRRRNKIDINVLLSNEISKQNYFDTICSSDKPFFCGTCAYRSKKKSDLTRHVRVHTGEKPYSCNMCSYKCSEKSALVIHLRTHTGEKPFACNICSFKCNQSSVLRRHLRIHTGSKPFSCNICSYKCNRKSNLSAHLRTHTGNKPFSCNICFYKCSKKSILTKHSKSHSGERSFSCDICAHKTKSKSEIRSHLFSNHVL